MSLNNPALIIIPSKIIASLDFIEILSSIDLRRVAIFPTSITYLFGAVGGPNAASEVHDSV